MGATSMNMMHPEADVTDVRTLAAIGALTPADRAAIDALPLLISADSHVMEPSSVWERIASPFRETVQESLKRVGFRTPNQPAGAGDPVARLVDQKRDGVEAEILFPNDGMAIFGLDDGATQHAAFEVYNTWLAEFCSAAPKHLFGVTCIAAY